MMREILITATVLILCILLIRRIFRRKIGSRMQYALWLLAALRLVIPVSAEFDLGSFSDFRLMDLVGEDESGIGERLEETIRLEEPIQMTVNSRSILFRLFTTDEIRETLEAMPKDGPTSVFMAGKLGFSRLDVLLFFWGIGGFIIGAWIIITNVVFSHRLKKRRKPFDLPEEVKTAVFGEKNSGLFRKKGRMPAFYAVEGISSPCLYGFPGCEAVYLTADVIGDTDKLRHVIVHELVHKKHGDSLWAVLRGVLVTVYWFHPLVWAAAVCSKRDCELACDEGALAALGEKERVPYGETLLSIITQKGHMSDLVCTATTMTGSGKSVKERIRFIAEKPKVFYAAAAGVLFLIAVVCLFVFTRDAQFHGTVVDAQEGLLVTGGDMQIPLPASIGGISGCVVEKESDEAVIYHLAAQEEVGRFARMPLKDALGLVDEGREVTPIGDYGYNYLLRAYLGEPLSRTEHTYTPAKEAATDYQPGMDEAGTAGETAGVPGTDTNDDTTYMIDDSGYRTEEVQEAYEGKTDYLPNEQIVEITYEPDEVNVDELYSGCYVYVKADFDGKVRDKYQEEMAYIDEELKTVVYQVIVLSLNRENRDALFDSLAANRTPYVGDHSKVGALLEALPLPPTLNREAGFSLQTLESPYALRFDYKMCMDHFTKDDQDMLYFNAAMLFYAIGNLEQIAVEVKYPSGGGSDMMIYRREELEKDLPMLEKADYEDDQIFRDGLAELQTAVEKYLLQTDAG
jgi:beta-lactamase regulating signal transducer with metallopeptidase domain